jgi:prophage regulatory protein
MQHNQIFQQTRFIRLPQVIDRVGMARPTIYRMIQHGQFPAPVKVGSAALWSEAEVSAWLDARIAERDARKVAGGRMG